VSLKSQADVESGKKSGAEVEGTPLISPARLDDDGTQAVLPVAGVWLNQPISLATGLYSAAGLLWLCAASGKPASHRLPH
jgi:hypothetical protein